MFFLDVTGLEGTWVSMRAFFVIRFEAAREACEEKEIKRRQKSMKPLMGMDHIPPHIRIWIHILLM